MAKEREETWCISRFLLSRIPRLYRTELLVLSRGWWAKSSVLVLVLLPEERDTEVLGIDYWVAGVYEDGKMKEKIHPAARWFLSQMSRLRSEHMQHLDKWRLTTLSDTRPCPSWVFHFLYFPVTQNSMQSRNLRLIYTYPPPPPNIVKRFADISSGFELSNKCSLIWTRPGEEI